MSYYIKYVPGVGNVSCQINPCSGAGPQGLQGLLGFQGFQGPAGGGGGGGDSQGFQHIHLTSKITM